jgi:hypothetical protein
MKSAVISIFFCFWNFPIIHSKISPINYENSDLFLCLKNLIKQWNEIELATHDIYIYNLIGENLDFVKFIPSENPLKIFNGFSKVDEPLRPSSLRIIISDHQLVRDFHSIILLGKSNIFKFSNRDRFKFLETQHFGKFHQNTFSCPTHHCRRPSSLNFLSIFGSTESSISWPSQEVSDREKSKF